MDSFFHPRYDLGMRYFSAVILGAILFGCKPDASNEKSAQKNSASSASTNATSSIASAPVDYIASSIQAGEKSKGTISLGVIRKAIESFQQEEGRNPASLEELLEKSYLKVMPPPPAAQKFQYDVEKGTVELVPQS